MCSSISCQFCFVFYFLLAPLYWECDGINILTTRHGIYNAIKLETEKAVHFAKEETKKNRFVSWIFMIDYTVYCALWVMCNANAVICLHAGCNDHIVQRCRALCNKLSTYETNFPRGLIVAPAAPRWWSRERAHAIKQQRHMQSVHCTRHIADVFGAKISGVSMCANAKSVIKMIRFGRGIYVLMCASCCMLCICKSDAIIAIDWGKMSLKWKTVGARQTVIKQAEHNILPSMQNIIKRQPFARPGCTAAV